jgi:hypothetical protein
MGRERRGGCFARAPVETALRFDLGGADRDGLLDAAIYCSAVHGSLDAQLARIDLNMRSSLFSSAINLGS